MAARVAASHAASISKRHRDGGTAASNNKSLSHLSAQSSSILSAVADDDDEVEQVYIQSNEILRLKSEAQFALMDPVQSTSTSNFVPTSCSTPKHVDNNSPNSGEEASSSASTSTDCVSAAGVELTTDLDNFIAAFQAQNDIMIANQDNPPKIRAPILGYEVIEQQDKFTAFKINVQRVETQENWFVFRRYTDFVRLHQKLTGLFPNVKLNLPPKRWFKDNFEPTFLEKRILGLQCFVNAILDNNEMTKTTFVTDFFCLNDPPSPNDNLQASRLRCECMETIICNLNLELKEKNLENEILKAELALAKAQKETLLKSLRMEKSSENPPADHLFSKVVHDRMSEASKHDIGVNNGSQQHLMTLSQSRTMGCRNASSPTGSDVYKENSNVIQNGIIIADAATDSNGNKTFMELQQI